MLGDIYVMVFKEFDSGLHLLFELAMSSLLETMQYAKREDWKNQSCLKSRFD